MDPNWTHIYCAWFSWSVTGMMMALLEPLAGWLCKIVFPSRCHCDSIFKTEASSLPLKKSLYGLTKKDDGNLIIPLSQKHKSIVILLTSERNMPGCVKRLEERGNSVLRCLSKSQQMNTKSLSVRSSGQNVSSHGRHARLSEAVEKL